MIKAVMTDKNKKKFRISQNLVLVVYRGDSETENAKMIKLLSKTQNEYGKNKLSNNGAFLAIDNLYPNKTEINGTLLLFGTTSKLTEMVRIDDVMALYYDLLIITKSNAE
jgi:hypothetical protein